MFLPAHFITRATLDSEGISCCRVSVCLSVRPSVRPSVTSRSSLPKRLNVGTQTTSHGSPETLVFCCRKSR